MPKYLVGVDRNSYSPEPLDFSAIFIITADSPYSRPTLIEPFHANDVQQVEHARQTASWIDEWQGKEFSLWLIWTTKTVVTDLDGNVIYPDEPSDPNEPPRPARRRVPRRG